ncbi:MAG: hypothetical protein ACRC50_08195 [Gaiella sp.]
MRWTASLGLVALVAVVVAVVATTALAAGGRKPSAATRGGTSSALGSRSPVAFLSGVVRQLAANDYARAYETLVPAQQRLVSRSAYVACESRSPIPGKLTSLDVLGVRNELVAVPGATGAPTLSTAVTFALRITGAGTEVDVRLTAHALRVGARLAWMLPAARLTLNRSPGCGAPVTVGDPSAAL